MTDSYFDDSIIQTSKFKLMDGLIKTVLILLIMHGCTANQEPIKQSIEGVNKVFLKKEGHEEFFYWEMNDEEYVWGLELGKINALNGYKDSIKLTLGEEKYNTAIRNESKQDLEKSLIEEEENGDRINALLVHTGSVGKIRKINYLESEILNYQIGRFPMFSKPTEFHGFIVRNIKERKIRVYFGSSDTEWPPNPKVIINELEKEMNKGWKLIGHLHNHYCNEDKDYVGILAPSLADAQYYKMLKERFNLDKALITNGIHTVEIDSDDFEKFESH